MKGISLFRYPVFKGQAKSSHNRKNLFLNGLLVRQSVLTPRKVHKGTP